MLQNDGAVNTNAVPDKMAICLKHLDGNNREQLTRFRVKFLFYPFNLNLKEGVYGTHVAQLSSDDD